MADLKVKFFGPPKQFSLTFTSSDSIILQHWPIDVTGFGARISPVDSGGDGTAYDSQNPRHADRFGVKNSFVNLGYENVKLTRFLH